MTQSSLIELKSEEGLEEELCRTHKALRAAVNELSETNEELNRIRNTLDQVNEDLNNFASIVTHDLTEPLRTIRGFTDILKDQIYDQLTEEQEKYFNYINRAATRMHTLIQDIREYSNLGKEKVEYEKISLDEVLDDALQNLHSKIEQNNVQVYRDALPTIYGSETRLLAVFQNLISNAIKFNEKETQEIHIRSNETDEEYEVLFSDNGIGVDPKYHQDIFKIFRRLHSKDKYDGTGTGLAIVKRVIENHGGRIFIQSASGVGSTFIIKFPKY